MKHKHHNQQHNPFLATGILLTGLIVMFIAGASIDSLTQDPLTAAATQEQEETEDTIKVPDSERKISKDEGTIVLTTKPPVKIFDQFTDARDFIQFFSAQNIEGLKIVYNIDSKRFYAGLPVMSTPEVSIFDDKVHELAYTYKKGGKQALFLDGKKVSETDYNPISTIRLTGYAVVEEDPILVKQVENTWITVYDESLNEEELKSVSPAETILKN